MTQLDSSVHLAWEAYALVCTCLCIESWCSEMRNCMSQLCILSPDCTALGAQQEDPAHCMLYISHHPAGCLSRQVDIIASHYPQATYTNQSCPAACLGPPMPCRLSGAEPAQNCAEPSGPVDSRQWSCSCLLVLATAVQAVGSGRVSIEESHQALASAEARLRQLEQELRDARAKGTAADQEVAGLKQQVAEYDDELTEAAQTIFAQQQNEAK